MPQPRRYPRPGEDNRRGKTYGDRGEHSAASVVTYLESLKPKGA